MKTQMPTENDRLQELLWRSNARRAQKTAEKELPSPEHLTFFDHDQNRDMRALFSNAIKGAVEFEAYLDDEWPALRGAWNPSDRMIVIPHGPTDTGLFEVPFWYLDRYREEIQRAFGAKARHLTAMSADASRGFEYLTDSDDPDTLAVWGITAYADGKKKIVAFRCRVCGLLLDDDPWKTDDRSMAVESCPCCDVEFGVGDTSAVAAFAHRERWLADGASWRDPGRRPESWDLETQLAKVPQNYR